MIECTEQDGSKIYRQTFEFTDEDYKKFLALPEEEDYAWNFWDDVGRRYGFNPRLIEVVRQRGQKTFWRSIFYIENTRRRKFSALTRGIKV